MFDSFVLAGFECATGFNRFGQWIDQVEATGHDRHLVDDLRLVRAAGCRAVRDGVRWPVVDIGGRLDLSTVRQLAEAANEVGVEIIYDLFHYGLPADVDIYADAFPRRFAAYCGAVAKAVYDVDPGRAFFTPVNEPSFFAWVGGEVGDFWPYGVGRGVELKRRLAEAAIAGINAIHGAHPRARIVNVDALCHVAVPLGHEERALEVHAFNSGAVYEGWDMIAGRMHPELGGSPDHLDIVGVNYYATNQWEIGSPELLIGADDPRHVALADLLGHVVRRYGQPMLLSETSHGPEHREAWLADVADEAGRALAAGVPLLGICVYPILGMPKWHNRADWERMGAWEIVNEGDRWERRPVLAVLDGLLAANRLLTEAVAARALIAA